MLMPMATDREKNIWPDAVFRTSKKLPGSVNREKSGWNMNL